MHRAEYDDWSFPKGKLDEGESWEDAAAREVEEETGLRASVGPEVGRTYYEVADGPKEVRYYRMEPEDAGEPQAQNEIDAIRWVPLEDAERLLTYDRDRRLLRELR